MTPTTYGRDFAYCLKSHGGVRGFNASLWRFLLRCTLFCHSVATFLTSVSSYEGGCGFEVIFILRERRRTSSKRLKVNSARDKKYENHLIVISIFQMMALEGFIFRQSDIFKIHKNMVRRETSINQIEPNEGCLSELRPQIDFHKFLK